MSTVAADCAFAFVATNSTGRTSRTHEWNTGAGLQKCSRLAPDPKIGSGRIVSNDLSIRWVLGEVWKLPLGRVAFGFGNTTWNFDFLGLKNRLNETRAGSICKMWRSTSYIRSHGTLCVENNILAVYQLAVRKSQLIANFRVRLGRILVRTSEFRVRSDN